MTAPELEPFDGELEPEGDYELLSFVGVDLGAGEAQDARFLDCVVDGANLDELRLDRAHVVDTSLIACHAGTLHAPDGQWRDVTVRDCRLGAVQAHGAVLTRVTVTGGKIDYLNLRGARIETMRLTGVTIGDLDLSTARVADLVLADCRVRRLDVQGATLRDVDLRGAEMARIDGPAGLKGARISEQQLLELASVFAAHLGVEVG